MPKKERMMCMAENIMQWAVDIAVSIVVLAGAAGFAAESIATVKQLLFSKSE